MSQELFLASTFSPEYFVNTYTGKVLSRHGSTEQSRPLAAAATAITESNVWTISYLNKSSLHVRDGLLGHVSEVQHQVVSLSALAPTGPTASAFVGLR